MPMETNYRPILATTTIYLHESRTWMNYRLMYTARCNELYCLPRSGGPGPWWNCLAFGVFVFPDMLYSFNLVLSVQAIWLQWMKTIWNELKDKSLPLSFSLSIVLYGIAWAYYCTLQMSIYSHNPLANDVFSIHQSTSQSIWMVPYQTFC